MSMFLRVKRYFRSLRTSREVKRLWSNFETRLRLGEDPKTVLMDSSTCVRHVRNYTMLSHERATEDLVRVCRNTENLLPIIVTMESYRCAHLENSEAYGVDEDGVKFCESITKRYDAILARLRQKVDQIEHFKQRRE